jgi:hypothetical protein
MKVAVLPTLILSVICVGGCIGAILLSRTMVPILDDTGYVDNLGSYVIMGPGPFVVAGLSVVVLFLLGLSLYLRGGGG